MCAAEERRTSKSKHKRPIADADLKKVYEGGVFSIDHPKRLLNKVFLKSCCVFAVVAAKTCVS